MRTKLPALDVEHDPTIYDKAKDNDALSKTKNKIYADDCRQAKDSDIEVGDKVIVRKEKKGKLDANYEKESHTVIGKQGSDIVCENSRGKTVRRNSTFVKVLPLGTSASEQKACQPNTSGNSGGSAGIAVGSPGGSMPPRRSSRCVKPPDRYGDYVVHALVGTREY
ncbi:uncharacterized protein [Watersipora subatra]|uniref:uncharacterized protein n=1 Tax=Watersipora subatra TaxID=2589382 RepID=UPI00355B358B